MAYEDLASILASVLNKDQLQEEAQNPWSVASNKINALDLYSPKRSNSSNILASLVQGLAGGTTKGIGDYTNANDREARYNDLANVLANPKAKENEDSIFAPFMQIDQVAQNEKSRGREEDLLAKTDPRLIDFAGKTAAAVSTEQEKAKALYDSGEKTTLLKNKQEDKLRADWQGRVKLLDTLIPIKNEAEALTRLDNPAADVALKELLQRGITPGAMAVRVEFFRKIDQAANPLNKVKGEVSKWLGGGDTAPETRKQILDTIKTIVDDKIGYYKNIADKDISSIARNRGLDMENIIPRAAYEELFGSIEESQHKDPNIDISQLPGYDEIKAAAQQARANGDTATRDAIIAKLRKMNLPDDKIRQFFQ